MFGSNGIVEKKSSQEEGEETIDTIVHDINQRYESSKDNINQKMLLLKKEIKKPLEKADKSIEWLMYYIVSERTLANIKSVEFKTVMQFTKEIFEDKQIDPRLRLKVGQKLGLNLYIKSEAMEMVDQLSMTKSPLRECIEWSQRIMDLEGVSDSAESILIKIKVCLWLSLLYQDRRNFHNMITYTDKATEMVMKLPYGYYFTKVEVLDAVAKIRYEILTDKDNAKMPDYIKRSIIRSLENKIALCDDIPSEISAISSLEIIEKIIRVRKERMLTTVLLAKVHKQFGNNKEAIKYFLAANNMSDSRYYLDDLSNDPNFMQEVRQSDPFFSLPKEIKAEKPPSIPMDEPNDSDFEIEFETRREEDALKTPSPNARSIMQSGSPVFKPRPPLLVKELPKAELRPSKSF